LVQIASFTSDEAVALLLHTPLPPHAAPPPRHRPVSPRTTTRVLLQRPRAVRHVRVGPAGARHGAGYAPPPPRPRLRGSRSVTSLLTCSPPLFLVASQFEWLAQSPRSFLADARVVSTEPAHAAEQCTRRRRRPHRLRCARTRSYPRFHFHNREARIPAACQVVARRLTALSGTACSPAPPARRRHRAPLR
jgi:hypothetical protein